MVQYTEKNYRGTRFIAIILNKQVLFSSPSKEPWGSFHFSTKVLCLSIISAQTFKIKNFENFEKASWKKTLFLISFFPSILLFPLFHFSFVLFSFALLFSLHHVTYLLLTLHFVANIYMYFKSRKSVLYTPHGFFELPQQVSKKWRHTELYVYNRQ